MGAARKFKRAHAGARRNWDIPNDFPNWRVVTAYSEVRFFIPHLSEAACSTERWQAGNSSALVGMLLRHELQEARKSGNSDSACWQAKVDSSKEAVTFARPDLEHLRNFCLEKFGWQPSKTDGLLTPVLKVREGGSSMPGEGRGLDLQQ